MQRRDTKFVGKNSSCGTLNGSSPLEGFGCRYMYMYVSVVVYLWWLSGTNVVFMYTYNNILVLMALET